VRPFLQIKIQQRQPSGVLGIFEFVFKIETHVQSGAPQIGFKVAESNEVGKKAVKTAAKIQIPQLHKIGGKVEFGQDFLHGFHRSAQLLHAQIQKFFVVYGEITRAEITLENCSARQFYIEFATAQVVHPTRNFAINGQDFVAVILKKSVALQSRRKHHNIFDRE